MPHDDCHVCDGRETIDSLIILQLGGAPVHIPLCRYHFAAAEGALREIRRIQTPPVIVNVSGVCVDARPGLDP